MSQRLRRIIPRDNLCTTHDGDAILHVHGTVVVWWYERIQRNPDAQTIPMVVVIFRFLDKDDRLAGVTQVSIGVSRMGSFRIGTIWKDGKCIAETDFGDTQEFSVDFTDGAWSYLSVTGKHNFPYFKQDHELRSLKTDSVVCDLLNFPLPNEKNLLIPCIDFLYRCYGTTSDIARILVTYEWSDVLEKLYASFEEEDSETWTVSPHPDVEDSDALFLATLRYNAKAELAAKNLYAQIDNALGHGIHETSLKVAPWFEGPAKVSARGRWINNGRTFLSLEVTGMSEPLHHSYNIRRDKRLNNGPERAEPAAHLTRIIVDIPKPQDPFPVTDKIEPGRNAGSWGKPDPSFARLGPACPFTRTSVERRYLKKETVTIRVEPPSLFSTGDPQGTPNGVSHIVHHAKRVTGDGGILGELWAELQYLKDVYPGFTSLAWYSEAQGFIQGPEFRLYTLESFDAEDDVEDGARRWLRYIDNATRLRGLLLIQAVIDGKTIYLFELQRKKKRQGKVFKDEQISGLAINVDDPEQAREVISKVCDQIRNAMGNFARLENLGVPPNIFRHYSHNGTFAAGLTLRKALEPFGIHLPLLQRDKGLHAAKPILDARLR